MSQSPLRIAIIGVGAIGRMHARAIGELDDTVLVAGCCRTEGKGRAFADEFDCRWYPDAGAMLDAERPDVATVCTPSGTHGAAARACFSRGIHVLCEKPLEITTERVDRMIREADAAGVLLGGIFPERFTPAAQRLHEAAAAGRFGDLALVAAYVPWWRDDAYYAPDRWQGTMALDGGGALINQAIHGVDLLQWVAAAAGAGPVVEVFAYTAQRGHDPKLIEVEDTAVAVLRFANGALGQLLGATSMYPGSPKRLLVAGRDGTAELLEDRLVRSAFRCSPKEDSSADDDRDDASRGGASDPMAINYMNHARNIAAFLAALRGRSSEVIDGMEARKAVAIVEAVYRSARDRQPVALTPYALAEN